MCLQNYALRFYNFVVLSSCEFIYSPDSPVPFHKLSVILTNSENLQEFITASKATKIEFRGNISVFQINYELHNTDLRIQVHTFPSSILNVFKILSTNL